MLQGQPGEPATNPGLQGYPLCLEGFQGFAMGTNFAAGASRELHVPWPGGPSFARWW